MDTSVMFLDCPAYVDKTGAARCGLPAAVEYRYAIRSTDGPLESAKIRCPRGHCFNGPIESLLWDKDLGAATPSLPSLRPQGMLKGVTTWIADAVTAESGSLFLTDMMTWLARRQT